MRILVLLTLQILVYSITATSPEEDVSGGTSLAQGVIDWIVANGGFFSDKMQIRPMNQNDPNSPNGIYALQDLPKGEVMLVVPRKCMITGEQDEDFCGSAKNLLHEYQLGEDSFFYPYTR